jgi:hypothetical protein
MTLQWATFIMATIAAVGSVVRVYQNERLQRNEKGQRSRWLVRRVASLTSELR